MSSKHVVKLTEVEKVALDKIVCAIEPLDDLHRLRVLASAAALHGHYDTARNLMDRAEILENTASA